MLTAEALVADIREKKEMGGGPARGSGAFFALRLLFRLRVWSLARR